MDYIVLAVQLAVFFATLYIFYVGKRGTTAAQLTAEVFPDTKINDNLVVEKINELITELKRTSAKINKDMAKQAATLQSLISEADARIEEMRFLETTKPKRSKVSTLPTPKLSEPSVKIARGNEAAFAYNSVLRLADEGMDSIEIAKQANMGRGEVELLLDLRKPVEREEKSVEFDEVISLVRLDEIVQPQSRGQYRMFGNPPKKNGYTREVEQ